MSLSTNQCAACLDEGMHIMPTGSRRRLEAVRPSPARTRNATGSTVAQLAGFMTAVASFGILLSPRVSSVSASQVFLWRSGVGIMGGRQYQANLPASLTVLIRRPIHRGNTSCIYTVTPSG